MAVSCPVGSFEAAIQTGVSSTFTIPGSVSGFQCTVSTVNLPAYYLPIVSDSVNIGMNSVAVQGAVNSINPGKFVGADFNNAFGVSPIDARAPAIGAGGAILKSANGAAGKRVKPNYIPRQPQKRVKPQIANKQGKQRRKH